MTKAVSSLGELGESVLLAGELRGSITPTVLVSRRIFANPTEVFEIVGESLNVAPGSKLQRRCP